ncbi:MAG: porin family protein [Henriciella sp.]|nr:porin family protein [Henriciella sp.]
MKKIAVAAVLVGAALQPSGMAQSDLYVSGGYSAFDSEGATLSTLSLRGGLAFHEILGGEFEASFGLGAEDLDGVSGAQVELENQFGAYLVGRYPVAQDFDVLARIGYTTGEYQSSNSGVTGDIEVDGVAFGVGGEYMLTDAWGVRADYTRIEAEDDSFDGGIDVFSISGVYKFGDMR